MPTAADENRTEQGADEQLMGGEDVADRDRGIDNHGWRDRDIQQR